MITKSTMTLAMLSLLVSCNEQGFTPVIPGPDDSDRAMVTGRVCDPIAKTWLEGATVYTQSFNSAGVPYETVMTTTDEGGYWALMDLAASDTAYQVYVQSGPEIIEEHQVTLEPGDIIVLDEPECFDPLEVAVVDGSYDDLGGLLSDVGVFSYTTVEGSNSAMLRDFLSDYDSMKQYDVILFNGGHAEEDVFYDTNGSDTAGNVAINLENVRQYVESGGTIYATDWSYDVIEQIWPDAMDFLGDDLVPDEAQQGESGLVAGDIPDGDLADKLGSAVVEVNFDLPVWPPVISVGKGVVTHIHADTVYYREGETTLMLNNVPLLASFQAGTGRVVFSSYRLAANDEGAMRDTFSYIIGMLND